MARRDASGNITPWAECGGPEWKAWALSEVRVRPRIAPLDSRSLPALATELNPIVARWGRFEQEIPVCVLEPDGESEWVGGVFSEKKFVFAIKYSCRYGILHNPLIDRKSVV